MEIQPATGSQAPSQGDTWHGHHFQAGDRHAGLVGLEPIHPSLQEVYPILFVPWPFSSLALVMDTEPAPCVQRDPGKDGASLPSLVPTPTQLCPREMDPFLGFPKTWTLFGVPQEMDPFWDAPRDGPMLGFLKTQTHFGAFQVIDPFWGSSRHGPILGLPKPITLLQNRPGS